MKIFYSWQSDLPNACNRGFIEAALEGAAIRIRADDSIEVEPVVDRDTQGVAGSPDIVGTIFQKIETAAIFACDVSQINPGADGRPTPNPNVLLELGYAIKTLGWSRIVMVMNAAYGRIEDLPFDLRARRVITYQMSQDKTEKATERKQLESKLESALKSVISEITESLRHLDEPTAPINPTEKSVMLIEQVNTSRIPECRRFMNWFLDLVRSVAPDLRNSTDPMQELLFAIPLTLTPVESLAAISNAIALMNDKESLEEVLSGLEGLLVGYYLPRTFSGGFNNTDFDFFKFVGHEAITTLVSLLIRERRWELISKVTERSYVVPNTPSGQDMSVEFTYFSQQCGFLAMASQKQQRVSVHADLLHDRHSSGVLADICPVDIFTSGDYFLFLRGQVAPQEEPNFMEWCPWSVLYMDRTPRFLLDAVKLKEAGLLAMGLGLGDVETLKVRLGPRTSKLIYLYGISRWFGPRISFDFNSIGTKFRI